MKKIFSKIKIKSANCWIGEGNDLINNETELFCYGNNKCDVCCGPEDCECNVKKQKIKIN